MQEYSPVHPALCTTSVDGWDFKTYEAADIKALNAEIARIVARQMELRAQVDAIMADLEGEDSLKRRHEEGTWGHEGGQIVREQPGREFIL